MVTAHVQVVPAGGAVQSIQLKIIKLHVKGLRHNSDDSGRA